MYKNLFIMFFFKKSFIEKIIKILLQQAARVIETGFAIIGWKSLVDYYLLLIFFVAFIYLH